MSDHTKLLADLEALQARVFLDGRHRYKVDGRYGPAGVTTALKAMAAPALVRWMVAQQAIGTARAAHRNPPLPNEPEDAFIARMQRLAAVEMEHERVSKAAADVGTQVHALVQFEIETMLGRKPVKPIVSEEALYRFAGWRQWAKDAGLKPLASEARLYNSTHVYAGTLDILALIRGHVSVIDIKPTPAVWLERRCQLSAYRMCVEALPGCPPTRGYINVLPRDGGDISVVEVDPPGPDYEASCAAFLHCLALYRAQAEHEKKMRAERVA